MGKELEPFADEEYEPQVIKGRMMLWLHGEQARCKKIEADKIPKLREVRQQLVELQQKPWYRRKRRTGKRR